MITLHCDKWDGVYNKGEKLENPSWDEIKKAISSLNQKERTQVVIQHEDWSNISVGGGEGQFHVCITTSDERFFVLSNKNKIESFNSLVVGGQIGNYPSETIVSISIVLKAVETFYKTKEADKELIWIEE